MYCLWCFGHAVTFSLRRSVWDPVDDDSSGKRANQMRHGGRGKLSQVGSTNMPEYARDAAGNSFHARTSGHFAAVQACSGTAV